MIITRISPLTLRPNAMEINVTQAQFDAWKAGAYIQEAMSNLTDDEREFIMTGLTPTDWATLFGEEEDTLEDNTREIDFSLN